MVTGCGDGKIARYPVIGTVLVDGRPAEGATVIFCPVEGPPEFMRERPFSQTDASGRFELTTLEPKDGAPAGNYTVMIRWLSNSGPVPANVDPDRGGGGRVVDRLGGRYFHPEKSGLTATVEDGDNDLKFELKSK
ncbi:MAG: hypothetical protein WD738_18235 [Pirellulales bacterium]